MSEKVAESPDAQLVADLVKAQAAFPTIAKDQKATIPGKNGGSGFGYSYASLGTVLSAVRPVLSEHGLALVQRTVCTANGKVNLLTELRHGGGGVLSSEVEIGQSSGNPQQFGGALTYLRRYEIVTLLGIAAEEDTDAQHVEPARSTYGEPVTPAWAQPASGEDKATVAGLLEAVVGHPRIAREYAATLSAKCGGFPDAVAKWLVALPDWQETAERAAIDDAPSVDSAEAETLAAEVFGTS